MIQNFVRNGGGLIVSADYQEFLNTVFDYSLVYDINGAPSLLSPGAAGTAFAGGPATLPPNDSTIGYYVASLPDTATSIYTDPTTLSTVTLFQYGAGQIVQLGYDFNNAAPLGNEDGGWLCVLNSAVAQVSGSTTNPNPSGSCNSNTSTGGNPVPEPDSLSLIAVAFFACASARRRQR